LLQQNRLEALLPLAKLADVHLNTAIHETHSDTTGDITHQVISKEVVDTTHLKLLQAVTGTNGLHIKRLKEVTMNDEIFCSFSDSIKRGLVEFPMDEARWLGRVSGMPIDGAQTQFHRAVGYIHGLYDCPIAGGKPKVYAVIASCVQSSNADPYAKVPYTGARLVKFESAGLLVIEVHLLAHVVQISWSADDQLIISTRNSCIVDS
jgi:hypothetical protein